MITVLKVLRRPDIRWIVCYLNRWKTMNGKDVTPVRFRKALINLKLVFIVHKYFDISSK